MYHPEATVIVTTDVQIWILHWKLDIWEFEGWRMSLKDVAVYGHKETGKYLWHYCPVSDLEV